MPYLLMATYLGIPYHAGLGPDGNEATLFSPAPPPDELGFTAAGGYWRKQVNITDLDALWQSRLVGEYRGEPCLVLDDLGDRLHIVYLGRDSVRASQLGYWEIDREVFEVVAARQDITGLTEERVDHPLASAMFPPSIAATQAPPGRGAHASAPRTPGGPPPSVTEQTRPLRIVPRPGPRPTAEPGGYREAGGYAEGGYDENRYAAGGYDPNRYGQGGYDPNRYGEGGGYAAADPRPAPRPDPRPGRRSGRRDRVAQSAFAELLSLAAIPQVAYAVGEEVPGAMCLVKADGGFEVFSRTDDARLDVRFFEDEEAAYFYLFGVLAAEAVHSGRLRPGRTSPA